MAREMGMQNAAQLLEQTLEEERRSSQVLASFARPLLKEAVDVEMNEVEAEADAE